MSRLAAAPADAAPQVPADADLDGLAEAAAGCTACGLYRDATQTVFGAGPTDARLMFVGEQPGDREDRAGAPFVGPAGNELDRGLEAAGIDRGTVYVTNAVKHFKFNRRGKQRLHATPNREEVDACLPWLRAEVDRIRPELVVALGATAAKAVIGQSFRVTRQHGQLLPGPDGAFLTATVHPSSILRRPDREARHEARRQFRDDLDVFAAFLHEGLGAALAQQTRDQLYTRAQELDVPGRSGMAKAELARAVADALRQFPAA